MTTTATIRSYETKPADLAELVVNVLGATTGDGWATTFTRTQGTLCRLADLDHATLHEAIWAHVFTPEVELRWREDRRTTFAIAIAADPTQWPPGTTEDLTMIERPERTQLPLLGHFQGNQWSQGNLRPTALDYRVGEINGRPPSDHDELAVEASVLTNDRGDHVYNWHRTITYWGAPR